MQIIFERPKPNFMDIKLKAQLRKITTFIFDVDGVLTDATVTVSYTHLDVYKRQGIKWVGARCCGRGRRNVGRILTLKAPPATVLRSIGPFVTKTLRLGIATSKNLRVFLETKTGFQTSPMASFCHRMS